MWNALTMEVGDIVIAKPTQNEPELFEEREQLALCTMRKPGYVAVLFANGNVLGCNPSKLQYKKIEQRNFKEYHRETLEIFQKLGSILSNGNNENIANQV